MYRLLVAGIGKDRWRLLQLRQNVNGAAREMQRRSSARVSEMTPDIHP
jgi:hypothetical protein